MAAAAIEWHQPWSEPTGTMQTAVIGLMTVAAIASGEFAPPVYYAVSASARLASAVNAVEMVFPHTIIYQALAGPVPHPDNFAMLSQWWQPFSEPVRIPLRLHAGSQQVLALHPSPVVSFSWFEILSEPVRVPPRLIEALQREFTIDPLALGVRRASSFAYVFV